MLVTLGDNIAAAYFGLQSPLDTNISAISHPDPANTVDLTRFTSRYLHMEGPFKILVSGMMPVFTGNRLGLMDDTGNSVLDHLHFCLHDRQIPFPGVDIGSSVRLTPLSGVTLEAGDDGTCVRSTNIETAGNPVKEISSYSVQNWLITPSALAVNEHVTQIREQRFLLILSGVAIVDVKGNSEVTWLHETVSLRPSLVEPLNEAISRWRNEVAQQATRELMQWIKALAKAMGPGAGDEQNKR